MTDRLPPPAGQYPARKIRILTELLIESFEQTPQRWGLSVEA
ncbi:hypothetical protein [Salinicola acroporae]|nr:hypothetical protein [Salinicola acroporae]